MKISKQQIEAIIATVKSNNKKSVDAKNRVLLKSPAIIKEVDRVWAIVEQIPKGIRENVYYLRSSKKEDIAHYLVGDKFVKDEVVDYKQLERDIIIASIESADLEQLKQKLNLNL